MNTNSTYTIIKKILYNINPPIDDPIYYSIVKEKIEYIKEEFRKDIINNEISIDSTNIFIHIKEQFYWTFMGSVENLDEKNQKLFIELYLFSNNVCYELFMNILRYEKVFLFQNFITRFLHDYSALIQFIEQKKLNDNLSTLIDELKTKHEMNSYILVYKIMHLIQYNKIDQSISTVIKDFFLHKGFPRNYIDIPYIQFDDSYSPESTYIIDLDQEYFNLVGIFLLKKSSLDDEMLTVYGKTFEDKKSSLNKYKNNLTKMNFNLLSRYTSTTEDEVKEWSNKLSADIEQKIIDNDSKEFKLIQSLPISEEKIKTLKDSCLKNIKSWPITNSISDDISKINNYTLKFLANVEKDLFVDYGTYIDLATPKLSRLAGEMLFGHLLSQLPINKIININNVEQLVENSINHDCTIFFHRKLLFSDFNFYNRDSIKPSGDNNNDYIILNDKKDIYIKLIDYPNNNYIIKTKNNLIDLNYEPNNFTIKTEDTEDKSKISLIFELEVTVSKDTISDKFILMHSASI